MANFTASMFEDIKNSLENEKNNSGSFRDILKTESGNSYVVRLIPNINEPKNTFYHYFHHIWQNPVTGQYVSCQCPTTHGERCPICEARLRLYRKGDDPETKELARMLKRKENWLVNVYVIDNPKNSDDNNQVKIFRYGKQIQKIVDDAMVGDDADEFGAAIFDLGKTGCNLRIKVETNEGNYPTYVSSKFLSPKAIPGMSADKIQEVYDSIINLESFFEVSSYEEIQELLKENTELEIETPKVVKKTKPIVKSKVEEVEEDEPNGNQAEDELEDESEDEPNGNQVEDEPNDEEVDEEDIDDKIADLLKDL